MLGTGATPVVASRLRGRGTARGGGTGVARMSKQGLRRERQNLLLIVKKYIAECFPAFHFIMTHIYIYL